MKKLIISLLLLISVFLCRLDFNYDANQTIRDKYPKFTLWIQDKNINFWE